MKFMRNLLILTTLISALLAFGVFAAEEAASDALITAQTTTQETTTGAAEEIVYTDVPEDATYAENVYKLSQYGVLNGYEEEDGTYTFRPEGEVTRAEMAKMIILTFGLADDYEDAEGFPDVSETDWFYPYVLAIQKHGIVIGYEDGTYRPQEKITRGEVCTIIYRMFEDDEAANTKKVLETSPFIPGIPDRTISDLADNYWGKNYVQTIVNNYLLPLEENNTFRPAENIKRYELANLLSKFVIEPVKPITAEVKFFVGGEQYGSADVVVIGDTTNPPEIEPVPQEGYAFMGWKVKGTEDTAIVDVTYAVVTGDVEYEAVFAVLHVVTFYNGDEVHDIQQVPHGKFAAKPTRNPTFGDMKFSGWYLTNEKVAENEVAVNFDRYQITKDMNFYARYTETGTSNPGSGDDGSGDEEPTNPNSEELMEKLNRGYRQLRDILMTNEKHIYIRSIIVDCVGNLIDDAENGNLIDKKYVDAYYGEQVDEIEYLVLDSNYLTPREASELSNLITNGVDEDVVEFMKEYFNLQI